MDPQTAAALERLRAVQPLLEAVERDIAAAEAGGRPPAGMRERVDELTAYYSGRWRVDRDRVLEEIPRQELGPELTILSEDAAWDAITTGGFHLDRDLG